jgi:hypothetical protein
MLRKHGHPMIVATRYMPQQHLIGSTVFPYYWFTLKTAIPLVLLAYTVAMSLTFVTQPVTFARVLSMMFSFPRIAINAAVWITIVFIVMDFAQAKYVKNSHTLYAWSPRKLPPLEDEQRVGTKSVFEVIASGLGLVWVLSIPSLPFLVLGPADSLLRYMQPAPVWHTFYWGLVVIMASQWMVEIVALFSAGWRRVRPQIGLVGQALTAVLFCLMLRANEFVALTDEGRTLPQYQSAAAQLNNGLAIAMKVTAIFMILNFFWKAGNLIWKKTQGGNPVMVEKH